MQLNNIKFSENDLTSADVERVNILLQQLSDRNLTIDFKKLKRCMKNGFIFTARDNNVLIGFALLTQLEKITNFAGTVEDIVVDKKYRGKKIGLRLMNNLLAKARKLKMQYTDLTSNAKRVVAQNLYKKIGFEKRDTDVFRKYFN